MTFGRAAPPADDKKGNIAVQVAAKELLDSTDAGEPID